MLASSLIIVEELLSFKRLRRIVEECRDQDLIAWDPSSDSTTEMSTKEIV